MSTIFFKYYFHYLTNNDVFFFSFCADIADGGAEHIAKTVSNLKEM